MNRLTIFPSDKNGTGGWPKWDRVLFGRSDEQPPADFKFVTIQAWQKPYIFSAMDVEGCTWSSWLYQVYFSDELTLCNESWSFNIMS
jgi:hypothetical protein